MYYTYDENGETFESAHLINDLLYSTGESLTLLTANINETLITFGDMLHVEYVAYSAGYETTRNITRTIYTLDQGQRKILYTTTDSEITNNEVQDWYINTGDTGFPQSGELYIDICTDQ
jgi:hypothetical protein